MTVNSFNAEFGYELIATIPYAYWLHKHGKLDKTISARDTECLYYFSPHHEINPKKRSWFWEISKTPVTAVHMMHKNGIPNSYIHKPELNLERWEAPPYKKAYANDWAVFDKPTYVVYNRYNNEWPGNPKLNSPINFFSLEFLTDVFSVLNVNYQVLYCNVEGSPELYDNAPPLHLEDRQLCKDFGVVHIQDLLEKHPGLTYNQVQMYYFANCQNFLTMNGGGGILASYFGGKNIIYTKRCQEMITGDFEYYHLFGDSQIRVVNTYEEVMECL